MSKFTVKSVKRTDRIILCTFNCVLCTFLDIGNEGVRTVYPTEPNGRLATTGRMGTFFPGIKSG